MGLARLRLGALLLYSFPRLPTVFYGDEAGMQGFEDPLNRGTYRGVEEDSSLLAYFRQLGTLAKQRLSLQCGDIGYLYAVGGGLVLAAAVRGRGDGGGHERWDAAAGAVHPLGGSAGQGRPDWTTLLRPEWDAAADPPPRRRGAAGVIVSREQLPETSALEKRDVSRETSLFCKVRSFPIEKNCDS